MKSWIHVIYLAIIVALASSIWLQPKPQLVVASDPESSSGTETVVAENIPREVAAYIADLENQISDLRQALQTEIAARQELADADSDAGANQTTSSTATAATGEQSRGRPAIDARNVDTQFAEEEIDPEWSVVHEQRLTDLMITDENLRQFSVADVECRSDTCQLTFYEDMDDPSTFTRELSRAVFQAGWDDQRFVTIMEQTDRSEELTIYLKRME